jgi:hypothetical protein
MKRNQISGRVSDVAYEAFCRDQFERKMKDRSPISMADLLNEILIKHYNLKPVDRDKRKRPRLAAGGASVPMPMTARSA